MARTLCEEGAGQSSNVVDVVSRLSRLPPLPSRAAPLRRASRSDIAFQLCSRLVGPESAFRTRDVAHARNDARLEHRGHPRRPVPRERLAGGWGDFQRPSCQAERIQQLSPLNPASSKVPGPRLLKSHLR